MLSFIRNLFRFIWKSITWLRIAILNLLFIAIIVVIIQGAQDAPQIAIPNESALVIAPNGVLVDQSTYNPTLFDALSSSNNRPRETVVHDLIKAVNYARDDDQITGIIMRLDYMAGGGISKIEELGQALNAFKESGKPIVAYADSMNQPQYLLASYADEIYLNPMGSVYLTGFGVYRNYYKSAAEKLALKFHVFRVGEYKDAVEPFMRDSMSKASKEHTNAWITTLWHRYAGMIEHHRDIETGTIDLLIENLDTELETLNGDAAQLAINKGLIDEALSRIELKDRLSQSFGTNKDGEVNAISALAYLNNPTLIKPSSENKIGLIIATGNILDGQHTEENIGSESLSELIQQAREDDELDALVIRVDSGGGSAFASEVIRKELEKTKSYGLPIYISMGSVAASGGYWISIPADEIWSTPTTITGSIGVFGLIPNIAGSLEKMGISSDGVGTSDLADVYNIDRDLSPKAKSVIQSGVDHIYQRFITMVAEARDSSANDIHKIAQGRVWVGETAQQLGLVDKLGSLQDVIKSAAKAQDLNDYSVKKITRALSPKEQFIRTLMQQTSTDAPVSSESSSFFSRFNALIHLVDPSNDLALFSHSNQSTQVLPNVKTFTKCLECIAP